MDKPEVLATPDTQDIQDGHFSYLLRLFVLCLVYPVLPVSLTCPFLMTTSVISSVYLSCVLCIRCSSWMDKPETLATPDTQDTGQINVRDNWSGHHEATSVISNVYLSCVLCVRCCQCLWLVHSWWPLQLSLTFICPVPCVSGVASVSDLSILDDHFSYTGQINVRDNWSGHHEWTSQRHWQHRTHKTQDK
jgi:hypothetical protein